MDKPIALISTAGTRGPQVKNAKIEVPRPWEFLKNIKSFKSVGTPFDLEPQTISEALVAAECTNDLQRTHW